MTIINYYCNTFKKYMKIKNGQCQGSDVYCPLGCIFRE